MTFFSKGGPSAADAPATDALSACSLPFGARQMRFPIGFVAYSSELQHWNGGFRPYPRSFDM